MNDSNITLANVKQVRICLNENKGDISIDFQYYLVELLTQCLNLSVEDLSAVEGEIMMVMMQLEARQNINFEILALIKELKLKMLRVCQDPNRFIRGRDNTDILKDKRDADGYITDLTLITGPFETKRICHRDGFSKQYTEEIYIDMLGRYFRRIFDEVEVTEDESAIASNILAAFDSDCEECKKDTQE